MSKTLALLVASTALVTTLGLPAWSSLHGGGPAAAWISGARSEGAGQAPTLVRASDDDDDDRRMGRSSDDDDGDHDDDDDDDDDCDDDRACAGSAANPAPAGTVAPPQNGLFGTGAPPKVQMN
jgi:hypothetical protein